MRLRDILRNAAAEGDAGGGAPAPAAQQPAESTPAHESLKKVPKGQAMRANDLRTAGELKAFIAQQKAGKAAPAPSAEPAAPAPAKEASNAAAVADAPTDKAEKTAQKIADKGGDVPEQRASESNENYELRLAKALQDLRDKDGQHRREKTRADAAEKKAGELEAAAKKLESMLARGKNPEDALDFLYDTTGLTLEDIVKGLNDGKIKPPRARASLPPEAAAEIEKARKMAEESAAEVQRLKEAEDARTQERQQQQQQQTYSEHLTQAGKYIEEHADEYPLLSKMSWAAQQVVHGAYQRVKAQTPLEAVEKGATLEAAARAFEDSLAENTLALLEDDRAMRAIEKRNPELAKKLAARYAPAALPAPEPERRSTQQAAPRHVGKLPTEAPTPPRVDKKNMTKREQARVAAQGMAAFLANRQGARR